MIDYLIGAHVLLQIALLFASAMASRPIFERLVAGTVLVQIVSQAALLWFATVRGQMGEIVPAFGNFLAGPGDIPFGGPIVFLVFALLYTAVLAGILKSFRGKELVCRRLHNATTLISAVFVLLLLPVCLFAKSLFWSGTTLFEAFRVLTIAVVGYGTILLRLETLRTLALTSFSHRRLVIEETEVLEEKAKKPSGWAFVFGVRWYFYKGLVGKASLLTIPFVLALIPGFPMAFLALTFIGTRLYCGLMGNKDYSRLKTSLKKASIQSGPSII